MCTHNIHLEFKKCTSAFSGYIYLRWHQLDDLADHTLTPPLPLSCSLLPFLFWKKYLLFYIQAFPNEKQKPHPRSHKHNHNFQFIHLCDTSAQDNTIIIVILCTVQKTVILQKRTKNFTEKIQHLQENLRKSEILQKFFFLFLVPQLQKILVVLTRLHFYSISL